MKSDRAYIETEVSQRTAHHLGEDVRTTVSFATAERLFSHEYHGRFLIELLQNAADAWRGHEGRSRLEIVLTEGPALLVANQGDPFPATTVIETIGHIGRSTKEEGDRIGHKGIGFKSVLEMTSAPEIYSGFSAEGPALAIHFDRRKALEAIRSASPDWVSLAAEQIEEEGSELALVPVLRYPTWVDSMPAEVEDLASRGFETVIRIPFRDDLRPDPELDEARWLADVDIALGRLSDEMLLLLGAFDEVVVDDRLRGVKTKIHPDWEPPVQMPSATVRERVTVTRNGEITSRWRLYKRRLPGQGDLASEIVTGFRLDPSDARRIVPVRGTDESSASSSAPFFLFFPTNIRSGLPLLLHGYFEVNAARTGFFDGAAESNGAILRNLAELVGTAVVDTADDDEVDLAGLVDLLPTSPPEDELAARFFNDAIRRLDDIAWVPVEAGSGDPQSERPTRLLVDDDALLVARLREAFPPSYVRRATGLGVPSDRIGAAGNSFLVGRRPEESERIWNLVRRLCLPGSDGPWPPGSEEGGFQALLNLVSALEGTDADQADELFSTLRGDDASVLIPVSASDGIRMRSLPEPSSGGSAEGHSRGIMARTGSRSAPPLVPPASFRLDFVPEGLLADESEISRADPLGIRPFTVPNILLRLAAATSAEQEPGEVAQFLWRLLTRASTSDFSVESSWRKAQTFDPAAFFWCRTPPRGAEAERQRLLISRALADVRLPARDGSWAPAGSIAFGADWADWMEGLDCTIGAQRERRAAYLALETISPGDSRLLAPPDVVLGLFGEAQLETAVAADEDPDPNSWAHAFLLSLGVWETIPVEALDRGARPEGEGMPWEEDPLSRIRDEIVEAEEGWLFGDRKSEPHPRDRLWIAQDFRFRWQLAEAARRGGPEVVHLLDLAVPLYQQLRGIAVACMRCTSSEGNHRKPRWNSSDEEFPSLLAVALRSENWVPARLNGEALVPQPPIGVWWAPPPVPAGAALSQSPLRFLRLCDPDTELPPKLRELAEIRSIGEADSAAILGLLESVRTDYETGALAVDPRRGSAKQAFVALHRQAYDRLAELQKTDEVDRGSEVIEVLCGVGDSLEYRPAGEAFHDDGSFPQFSQYLGNKVPLVQIEKPKRAVADVLGVRHLDVEVSRLDSGKSQDVTSELGELLFERIPEFLAILVYHVIGGQTLDPTLPDFERRASRLKNLRVLRVDDLVIEAKIKGTRFVSTIGAGRDEELFLEGATTMEPVLYHDLGGDGWQERLRRKLAPHLARILGRPDYADVFTVFLLAESPTEREATLSERGITRDEVGEIRSMLGLASEVERDLRRAWVAAILEVLSGSAPAGDGPLENAARLLAEAGLPVDVADRVSEHGGDAARTDVEPDGVLALLRDNHVDLARLDRVLRSHGDSGLRIGVAARRLRDWRGRAERMAAATLAPKVGDQQAKSIVAGWRAPDQLAHDLDPSPSGWLAPVTDSFKAAGLTVEADALAGDPEAELLRVSSLTSREVLEDAVNALYDSEERERILSALAASWRDELRLLAILAVTGPGQGPATIAARAEEVDKVLPRSPTKPSELVEFVSRLLPEQEGLALELSDRMTDSVVGSVPGRSEVLAIAERHGMSTAHARSVQRALERGMRESIRRVQDGIADLAAKEVRVAVPEGLAPPPPKPKKPPRRKIPKKKFDPAADRRKRELGRQGESWALAAMIEPLLKMSPQARADAIDEILALIGRLEGAADLARAHAEAARNPALDDEALIEALTGLLHLSEYSDAFGFDMLGWIAPDGSEGRATLLEVKSSADGSFHLSPNEWNCAEEAGSDYSVLVVRRSTEGAVPKSLDLLNDPVARADRGELARSPDGYLMSYIST